ncbi:hypothetical protein QR78_23680 [Methylobacterium indicum]|uniref:Glutamyl-tRNA reductase n=2 Tax=Methylobacterium indicum TaxID=1775910 RepID=A0ABR5H0L6_9HYPH|nr:hypothetical protein QR78_23680 [Methylobacterium indicum]KMO16467.1 hypothetical protein QR79_22925 [Methylobacterium indicum]
MPIMQEAAVVIAIVATAALAARELVRMTAEARRRARLIDGARADLSRCLAVTERALADERVPALLKAVLSNQAAALGDPAIGRARVAAFSRMPGREDGADRDDPIDLSLDRLAAIDAGLAFDCRAALTQGLMALLLLHADTGALDRATRDVVRRRHGLPARLDVLFGDAKASPGGPMPAPV